MQVESSVQSTCLIEKREQKHYTHITQTERSYDMKWKLPQMHTAKMLNAWPGHTLLNGSQFSFNRIMKNERLNLSVA